MSDQAVVLAEVVRSGFVESRHRGTVVALHADGSVALEVGATSEPVFPRSALKPLQSLVLVDSGAMEKFDLSPRHLALATSSHSGEQMHVDGVRDLLVRADVPESALGCPHELPIDPAVARQVVARGLQPARILNNCSGKHAGFLAACAAQGWPLHGYLDPQHPLQLAVRARVEAACGETATALGVDGCGAPVFAFALGALAHAFAALVQADGDSPEGTVAAAVRAHPELVGGTDRDVTRLMRAVPGLLAKDGAEAVFAGALPDGRAVAMKLDDGAGRGRTPVMVAALRRLGVDENDELAALASTPVLGGGEPAGEVRAVLP